MQMIFVDKSFIFCGNLNYVTDVFRFNFFTNDFKFRFLIQLKIRNIIILANKGEAQQY